jgi:hypothetical protein
MIRPGRLAFTRLMALAVLTCLALIGFNSFTRIREFSPDSMSYVDVARNFVTGRGISQSALGFGRATFTPDDSIPSPFTAHAPAFSMLIALIVASTRVRFETAALALPVVFLGLSLVAAYFISRHSYGESIAWLSTGVLLNYYPLRHVAAAAWSETTTIFFMLCALWLLTRYYQYGGGAARAWAIGLCAGLAFATRYPMGVIIPIAGVAIVSAGAGRVFRDGAFFLCGVLVSAGPVLLRNVLLTGTLAGAASNPYRTPVTANLSNTIAALSECFQPYYLQSPPGLLELRILIASLLIACVTLAFQKRLPSVVSEIFLRKDGARWLALWSVSYLVFLIAARSVTWFDEINHRLTVPAGITLAMLWTAFIAKTIGTRDSTLAIVSALLVIAAVGREASFAYARPPVSREMPSTPRLQWVASNTTERDLIIGDYTMDLPVFSQRRNAITFEHYPYTKKPTYEGINAYVQRHCPEYDHVYLIVRKWYPTHSANWAAAFGPMIADIVDDGSDRYPGYHPIAKLDDSYVWRIEAPACVR